MLLKLPPLTRQATARPAPRRHGRWTAQPVARAAGTTTSAPPPFPRRTPGPDLDPQAAMERLQELSKLLQEAAQLAVATGGCRRRAWRVWRVVGGAAAAAAAPAAARAPPQPRSFHHASAAAAGPRGITRTAQAVDAVLSVAREALQPLQSGGAPEQPPVLLRKLFERLGATYIKLGQFIASSPTLFPPDYVLEFQKCLDQTTPVPFSVVRCVGGGGVGGGKGGRERGEREWQGTSRSHHLPE